MIDQIGCLSVAFFTQWWVSFHFGRPVFWSDRLSMPHEKQSHLRSKLRGSREEPRVARPAHAPPTGTRTRELPSVSGPGVGSGVPTNRVLEEVPKSRRSRLVRVYVL